MSFSRAAVESVAALCAAIPNASLRVTTSSGTELWISEHPDAQLCPHAFRAAVAAWDQDGDPAPNLTGFEFDGFETTVGNLAREGERWIVSPLNAQATAECVSGLADLETCLEVLVREDLDFGLSVVRFTISPNVTMASPRQAETLLNDAAIGTYAACLAEELIAVSHPPLA